MIVLFARISPTVWVCAITGVVAVLSFAFPIPAPICAAVVGGAAILAFKNVLNRARKRDTAYGDAMADLCTVLGVSGRQHQDAMEAAEKMRAHDDHWAQSLGINESHFATEDRLPLMIRTRDGVLKNHLSSQSKAEEAAGAIADTPLLCRLSKAQLDEATRQSEKAAWSSLHELRTLTDTIVEFGAALERGREERAAILAYAAANGHTVRQVVEAVRGYFNHQGEGVKKAALVRRKLGEQLVELREHTRDVEQTISRLTSLTFNATIEYSRGEDSKASGVSVIVGELAKLSKDTTALTHALHTSLNDIQATYGELENLAASQEDSERNERSGLAQRLNRREATSVELERQWDGMTSLLTHISQRCSDGVMSATGQLQSQDVFRQKLESVSNTIDALSAFSEGLRIFLLDPNAQNIQSIGLLIEQLKDTYVTEDQRRLHALLVGDEDADKPREDLPDIELF
ncbi:MAG: hypothetical protein AAGJ94_03990 [Pseudomonadota bacterium]